MSAIVIDIILAAIVLLTVLISIKQGFIKVFVGLVGVVVALSVSIWFSAIAADFVFEKAVAPAIESSITTTIEEVGTNSKEAVIESLPETAHTAAGIFGINLETIVNDSLGNTISNTATEVSESLVDNVVGPFVTAIIRLILFIIFYIVIILLINLIAKALNLVAKLPVLKSANKFLGAILGLLKGLIIVFIICFVLNIALNFIPNGIFGINRELLSESQIYTIFTNFKI